VDPPRRESMLNEKSAHRLRGDDNGPESAKDGFDPQVALKEPGEPRARYSGWQRPIVAADPKSDFLGQSVQCVDDMRRSGAPLRPDEEARPPVVCVDDVSFEMAPDACGPREVELVAERNGDRLDAGLTKAGGDCLARAQHSNVDSSSSDVGRQIAKVGERPASLEARGVDDLQTSVAAERRPSAHNAVASPPKSQNGAKYCSERNIPETTATTSAVRTVIA